MKKMIKNGYAFRIASRHRFGLHFESFWGALGEPLGVKLRKKRRLKMDRKKYSKNSLATDFEEP